MRWARGVVGAIAVLSACTVGSTTPLDESALSGAGTPLPDGLVVAEHTRLIGPVIPDRDGGWVAWGELLTDDPLAVHRDYSAQVRRLGGQFTTAVTSCHSQRRVDTCEGGGRLGTGNVSVYVAAFERQKPWPAVVRFTPAVPRTPVAWPAEKLAGRAPTTKSRSTVQHPADQRYQETRLRLEPGSALVAPSIAEFESLGGWFFVVRARDPRQVLESLARQVGRDGTPQIDRWSAGEDQVLHFVRHGMAGGPAYEAWATFTPDGGGFVTVHVADRT